MNDVIVTQANAVAEAIDGKKIKEYLDAFGLSNGMNDNEVKQFSEIAQAFQLNPFKREIYCIPYGEGEKRRLSIITGYEVYLKRAERLGKLTGWRAWTEGSLKFVEKTRDIKTKNGGTWKKPYRAAEGDLKAVVEIHRVDWKTPFVHEVYLDEYYQDNEMWGSKPRTMLKKVCIAQAFRLAFPDEMGGMPYTKDELPDEMVNVTEPEPQSKEKEKEPTPKETEEPKKSESIPVDAQVFRSILEQIVQTMQERDESESYWFSDEDRDGYKETAKSIGTMQNKERKLKAINDLLLNIQGALAQKQDDRATLNSLANKAFEEEPELSIF